MSVSGLILMKEIPNSGARFCYLSPKLGTFYVNLSGDDCIWSNHTGLLWYSVGINRCIQETIHLIYFNVYFRMKKMCHIFAKCSKYLNLCDIKGFHLQFCSLHLACNSWTLPLILKAIFNVSVAVSFLGASWCCTIVMFTALHLQAQITLGWCGLMGNDCHKHKTQMAS